MKSTDHVGFTFATLVLGRGILNGVVNVTLGAYEFNPTDDKIVPDPAITCRLRLDVPGARALRDNLTELLKQVEGAPPSAVEAAAAEGTPATDAKH